MVYVALLRGINVGGNSKVEMPRLKSTFERLGFTKVVTYINSGNVIFYDDARTSAQIVVDIEKGIQEYFGFAILTATLYLLIGMPLVILSRRLEQKLIK